MARAGISGGKGGPVRKHLGQNIWPCALYRQKSRDRLRLGHIYSQADLPRPWLRDQEIIVTRAIMSRSGAGIYIQPELELKPACCIGLTEKSTNESIDTSHGAFPLGHCHRYLMPEEVPFVGRSGRAIPQGNVFYRSWWLTSSASRQWTEKEELTQRGLSSGIASEHIS